MSIHDFSDCLRADGVDSAAVARRIQGLPVDRLPLAAACQHGGHVDAASLRAGTVRSLRDGNAIIVTIGLFFDELIGGCNCSDDPVAATSYAEFDVCIDLAGGQGSIRQGTGAASDHPH
jgi:hypothetical protein